MLWGVVMYRVKGKRTVCVAPLPQWRLPPPLLCWLPESPCRGRGIEGVGGIEGGRGRRKNSERGGQSGVKCARRGVV